MQLNGNWFLKKTSAYGAGSLSYRLCEKKKLYNVNFSKKNHSLPKKKKKTESFPSKDTKRNIYPSSEHLTVKREGIEEKNEREK